METTLITAVVQVGKLIMWKLSQGRARINSHNFLPFLKKSFKPKFWRKIKLKFEHGCTRRGKEGWFAKIFPHPSPSFSCLGYPCWILPTQHTVEWRWEMDNIMCIFSESYDQKHSTDSLDCPDSPDRHDRHDSHDSRGERIIRY